MGYNSDSWQHDHDHRFDALFVRHFLRRPLEDIQLLLHTVRVRVHAHVACAYQVPQFQPQLLLDLQDAQHLQRQPLHVPAGSPTLFFRICVPVFLHFLAGRRLRRHPHLHHYPVWDHKRGLGDRHLHPDAALWSARTAAAGAVYDLVLHGSAEPVHRHHHGGLRNHQEANDSPTAERKRKPEFRETRHPQTGKHFQVQTQTDHQNALQKTQLAQKDAPSDKDSRLRAAPDHAQADRPAPAEHPTCALHDDQGTLK